MHKSNNYLGLLARLVAVSIIFIAYVSITYIWLLPQFFPGLKTYFFFISGVLGATLCSGYYGYRYSRVRESAIDRRFLAPFSATIVGAFVAYVSLLVILNVIGA